MAGTPIMYGRGLADRGDNSPSDSPTNNDSFSCLEKSKKESTTSQFGSPDIRAKTSSFGGALIGQKSPDLAKSNLKRALLNNMKDFPMHPDQPEEEERKEETTIKTKGKHIK